MNVRHRWRAKDRFHDVVKTALIQDGWTITHDPLPIDYGDVQMQIDLGAERLVAAQRGSEKIAVEVKSFIAPSTISEFHTALGQFLNYRSALRAIEPIRILYLAVPLQIYEEFFRLRFIQEVTQEHRLNLLIYDVEQLCDALRQAASLRDAARTRLRTMDKIEQYHQLIKQVLIDQTSD